MPLHNLKILDDNLRARPDQDLALASLLGIVQALQSIGQNTHTHHFRCFARVLVGKKIAGPDQLMKNGRSIRNRNRKKMAGMKHTINPFTELKNPKLLGDWTAIPLL